MQITFQQVEYRYSFNTPFEKLAIQDIDLTIPTGQFLAVIGHTGSGKSTLLQHLNGLLKPTEGVVQVGEHQIKAKQKAKSLKPVRQKVGIVFQFPEHQLFEETVLKDICYGPMNFGVSEEEAIKRAKELIVKVGLSEEVLNKSPFDLSGGQMRRVAIAGVLAMNPEVIVLDEPTAGLDPRGQREIMDMFYDLHKEKGLTTILVTHSMEDAAHYAEEIVIMQKGRLKRKGSPEEIFSSADELFEMGLDVPDVVRFQYQFEHKTGKKLPKTCLTIEELASAIRKVMDGGEAL
ncbi:energy-coupling factor ABC transporter ATP-binding protein [Rossellomorea aquimaris]|jgi:energy-coupling factor transport system ATP-binding protein|uniref:Energy-coupling factor transporter ATP-binding protein EcfA2 n=1 Tax=Rossellomorea aquimaris TaxID=189382 RepID=A0A5D4TW54_9BACI|nr:energy-coupling factor ABC transporter ATP-binding protein [Rossellomorea aquimaris]TYS74901.1 energy-coupling factor ABC transporter ATP-binding protein [Rossellomorea aquimaris]TYS79231.1 energy-coupling factor ABC transporter ATP-binding protein [Rossellomorea aquimaris]TYS84380.1 energy-coupling factor ABC transporter ATP-binding protein [Rossellomorea aquimaris]